MQIGLQMIPGMILMIGLQMTPGMILMIGTQMVKSQLHVVMNELAVKFGTTLESISSGALPLRTLW